MTRYQQLENGTAGSMLGLSGLCDELLKVLFCKARCDPLKEHIGRFVFTNDADKYRSELLQLRCAFIDVEPILVDCAFPKYRLSSLWGHRGGDGAIA